MYLISGRRDFENLRFLRKNLKPKPALWAITNWKNNHIQLVSNFILTAITFLRKLIYHKNYIYIYIS
jgi:hypothetical protein